MHSSIINKIRILKPRKRVPPQPVVKKSFTINNDNFHSSIVLQSKNDNMPPPLEPPKSTEAEIDPKNKWVPFYVVNVPKGGLGLSSTLEPESDFSQTCPASDSVTKHVVVNKTTFVLSNQDNESSNEKSNYSQTDESILPTTSSLQASNNTIINTQRVTRPRVVKINNSVNCFLCPTIFDSVQEMQDHYLENHKHKKRTSATNQKSISKKTGRSSTKPKDPLTLTDSDCDSGDGEPKCPICSIYFKTKEEVKSHMTNVHCYKCSECHNTFYTLFQFTDHRCSKYVKPKKPKLKKKKVKIIAPKETVREEEDPLALPSNSNKPLSKPKKVPILVKTSLPSLPSLPLATKDHEEDSAPSTITQTCSNTQTHNTNTITVSNINDPSIAPSILMSCSEPSVPNNTYNSTAKSLLGCSLEELTSKEFNKMKLNEIIRNPHLSINWIPKKNESDYDLKEFYSCGRCNVLCEDKCDYVEHLEECLRLSNVSLVTTNMPPQRILKLRSQAVPQKVEKFAKTTINQKLLKELKQFIGSEHAELFDLEEDEPSERLNVPASDLKSDLQHPDIKGNISITRVKNSKSSLKGFGLQGETQMIAPVKVTQSVKCPLTSSSIAATSIQQPMVIIPLDNPLQANSTSSNENDDPVYPNISITDKSNSVTWNFIGPESGAVLRMESSNSESNKVFPNNKYKTVQSSTSSSFMAHETEVIDMKVEPSSPSFDESFNTGLTSEDFKDSCSSMELVLDEDEIKMEVEDEVVDDRF